MSKLNAPSDVLKAAELVTGRRLIAIDGDSSGSNWLYFCRWEALTEVQQSGRFGQMKQLLSLDQARQWCAEHPENIRGSELVGLATQLEQLHEPQLMLAAEFIAGAAVIIKVSLKDKLFQLTVVPAVDLHERYKGLALDRDPFCRVMDVNPLVDSQFCVNASTIKPLLGAINRIRGVVNSQ